MELAKVGCWFSAKKKKKVNFAEFDSILRKHGFQLVEIDFSNFEEQGPFVAIVHKITDMMIEAMHGSEVASRNVQRIQSYIDRNPKLLMIDPLEGIRKPPTESLIHSPTFTLLTSTNHEELKQQIRSANVKYPFVCKRNIAHGVESHEMSIIFNEDGLSDVNPPCVVQTFIDHGALLYKIFVVGTRYHIMKRPSLRNFSDTRWSNHPTIFFNSHHISSCDSAPSKLSTLEDGDIPPREINEDLVNKLVQNFNQEINMTLYGADIIVCGTTGKHYIIDINVFPGYDGVDDFYQQLSNHISTHVQTS
nr:inositol-tetrakisphosphate 1-kinase-like [Ciona intestinalis]|eukprot:XP_002120608.3 inositol-tetrakisphosphate 1-kinase-like [Ciona intestinalis]